MSNPSESKEVDLASQMQKFETNFAELQAETLTPEAIMGAINRTLKDISTVLGANYMLNPIRFRAPFSASLKRLFEQIAEEGRRPELTIKGATILIEFTSQEGEKTIVDKWWTLSAYQSPPVRDATIHIQTHGVNLGDSQLVMAGSAFSPQTDPTFKHKPDNSVGPEGDLVSEVEADMSGELVDGATLGEEE
jgi:hypothetical protein